MLMSVTRYLCISGQAVSASSHLRRTWSCEGGHYSPGSVGSSSIEGHAARGDLTGAWTLCPACCLPADPSSQPDPSRPHWGSESPPGQWPGDRWAFGRLFSAWLKKESRGRNSSVSLYDVSQRHPLSVHHIFSCILFLVSGGHVVCVWTSSVWFLCELRVLDKTNEDPLVSQHAHFLVSVLQCWQETLAVQTWLTCNSLFH